MQSMAIVHCLAAICRYRHSTPRRTPYFGVGSRAGAVVVSKNTKRVAKPLMVALSMVMIDELGDGPGARVLEFVCTFGHDGRETCATASAHRKYSPHPVLCQNSALLK